MPHRAANADLRQRGQAHHFLLDAALTAIGNADGGETTELRDMRAQLAALPAKHAIPALAQRARELLLQAHGTMHFRDYAATWGLITAAEDNANAP